MTKLLIGLGAVAVGLGFAVIGLLIIISGHPIEVTRTEYTGEWGIFPFLFGVCAAAVGAVALWDATE